MLAVPLDGAYEVHSNRQAPRFIGPGLVDIHEGQLNSIQPLGNAPFKHVPAGCRFVLDIVFVKVPGLCRRIAHITILSSLFA